MACDTQQARCRYEAYRTVHTSSAVVRNVTATHCLPTSVIRGAHQPTVAIVLAAVRLLLGAVLDVCGAAPASPRPRLPEDS
jgi:hypothetical protein